MPRITIVAVGSRGDVQPYLALGSGLAAAGADVTVATHDRFGAWTAETGLGFHPLPGDPLGILRSNEGARWQEQGRDVVGIARGLAELAGPLADAFLDACTAAVERADLVLFSALGVAAHHVAEAVGIPAVGAWLQPLTPTAAFPHVLLGGARLPRWANRPSHRVVDQVMWRFVAATDRRWRRRLGLAPFGPAGPFHRVREGRLPVLYGMSEALVPRPVDWPPSVAVTGAWRLPGGPLDGELRAFLDDGPPPVVVGFGSRLEPSLTASAAIEAARRVGVRLVLLTGWAGLDPGGGDDVFVAAEAPHDRLLPGTAGFVHHGGAGTTHAGVAAGVPSFVAPSFADQFFWAHRVGLVGAGERLSSSGPRGFELAFSRMLHQPWPGARRAAHVMAREDGVARAVGRVRAHLGTTHMGG